MRMWSRTNNRKMGNYRKNPIKLLFYEDNKMENIYAEIKIYRGNDTAEGTGTFIAMYDNNEDDWHCKTIEHNNPVSALLDIIAKLTEKF
jgi:hypothetical protein